MNELNQSIVMPSDTALEGGEGTDGETKRNSMIEMVEDKELRVRRDRLLAEKNDLDSEIEALGMGNYKLEMQAKELEIQLLDKNKKMRKLSDEAVDLRRALLKPIADESGLLAEIDFLEEEKAGLVETYNRISDDLSVHISTLGSTILGIDFTKGEIAALKNKVTMIEYEVPQKFDELDYLIEKIEWTSKALANLFSAMKTVEKTTKLSYYKKG
ncbi:hypothetical protein [Candidatus Magnetominusculus xianensis]|uniref:Magnetosome protein Mad24 n=1 Tax=Candidatus Magnetominusculus xianensis TaxID=1748249 RepID=A0ABR5SJM8_9BACT|nr:hypothetical protein [Candidatus Magnetominusculus xianensis]KWT94845.1 magnetosome protein Mad24 [Candidatus Magnetominusculus xianensis]MBF0404737.1 hypothetical protein [Nitrospirota bacterium]